MRTLTLVILLSLMAACSERPTVINPNKSAAEAQADYDQCQGRSAVAAALTPKGNDPEALHQKALDECMKEKGYVVR